MAAGAPAANHSRPVGVALRVQQAERDEPADQFGVQARLRLSRLNRVPQAGTSRARW